jgi:hypothetical protein
MCISDQYRRDYGGLWGNKVDAGMHLDTWRRLLDKEEPAYAT